MLKPLLKFIPGLLSGKLKSDSPLINIIQATDKREKVGTTRFREEKALKTFLKRTKDGEYAKIDRSALAYPWGKEQRGPYYNEEGYYYSLKKTTGLKSLRYCGRFFSGVEGSRGKIRY